MNKEDKKRFLAVMHSIALSSSSQIDNDKLRLYSKAMNAYTIDEIESAGKRVLATWKQGRFPPIAIFIESLNEGDSLLQVEDRALTEATKIIAHVKTYGANVMPAFDDFITKQLMNKRWPYNQWASDLLESEVKWWVKEFCDAYRAHSNQNVFGYIEAPKKIKALAANLFD